MKYFTEFKNLVMMAFAVLLLSSVSGCYDADGEISGQVAGESESVGLEDSHVSMNLSSGTTYLTDFGYKYGQFAVFNPSLSYTDTNIKNFLATERRYLDIEYANWLATYVTSEGAGGFLRVQRDFCTIGAGNSKAASGYQSNYDTVSEGIGYGMLLAVYFNDKFTFDNLWQYAKLHSSPDTGLMQWKVRRDGVNISEFGLPIPHGNTKIYVGEMQKVFNGTCTIDDVQYNTSTSSYMNLPSASVRDFSSAADADFDMAAALCLAVKKWGRSSNRVNYVDDACKLIKNIYDRDFNLPSSSESAFIRNGSTWGKRTCWNPSYFAPAWFKLYIKFLNAYSADYQRIYNNTPVIVIDGIKRVTKNVYADMNMISKKYNGLFPDWCDTTGGLLNISKGSDRIYYYDENHDGVIDNANGEQLMSFNYYYDAIRVPWRMALDYSWNGGSDSLNGGVSPLVITNKIATFFYGKEKTLVDGYSLYGYIYDSKNYSWKYTDRDGFNNYPYKDMYGNWISSYGGQGYPATTRDKTSPTFVAMTGCSYIPNTSYQGKLAAYNYYQEVKYKKCPVSTDTTKKESKYHYYGNTLRMLSLLYMSGFMTDLYHD